MNDSISMIEVLMRCRDLLQSSEESDWAADTPTDIAADLDCAIEAIKINKQFNRAQLRMLFAPTGSIQEIAMENGWGEEYMRLSKYFDNLVGH